MTRRKWRAVSAATDGVSAARHHGVDARHHGGGRQRKGGIGDELLAHADVKGPGRGDGRVRNHREVVPEHGAPHHRAGKDAGRERRFAGEPRRDRHQGGDGSAAGSQCQRDQARDHEHARQHETGGNDRACDRYCGVYCAGCFCGSGKCPGEDEDEAHQHEVRLAHATGERLEPADKRPSPIHGKGRSAGHRERDGHGDGVERSRHNGEPRIEQHENAERQQRPCVRTDTRT